MLFSICLVLILVYFSIFLVLFSLMRNLYSEREYFHENLKIEKKKINRMKEEIFELKEAAQNNLFKTGIDCYDCWHSLLELDYDSIYSYMALTNQSVKKSYEERLSPLQKLLIGLSFGNIYLMMSIYIKPVRLFIFSVLLCLINLCIYGEIFLGDQPNVYYPLSIGISMFFFSIFFLLKILLDLLMIIHYQSIKKDFPK